MVHFRIHQNIMSASQVWHPGQIMPVEDEHADRWAAYEEVGSIERLDDDDPDVVAFIEANAAVDDGGDYVVYIAPEGSEAGTAQDTAEHDAVADDTES